MRRRLLAGIVSVAIVVSPVARATSESASTVLTTYEAEGVHELALDKLSDILKIKYGSTADAKSRLGDIPSIRGVFLDIQKELYRG